MAALRRSSGGALTCALADLGGESRRASRRLVAISPMRASAQPSIPAARRSRTARQARRLPDPDHPDHGSGRIVLGMGKLGAHELNYSSDIDLIVLFDPTAPAIAGSADIEPTEVRPPGAAAGPHPAGAHRRRLCLPHRPAAAARSGLDTARHPDRRGAALLREQGPELGARRHDQGAPRGRRPRRRRGVPGAISRRISGANTSTMRRSTTSIRSSARSTPIAAMAKSRSRATTSSSAAAAFARSSSSSRPSS